MGLIPQNVIDYGTDVNLLIPTGVSGPSGTQYILDLDPTFRIISGLQVLLQSTACILTTTPGTLQGNKRYGYNLVALLNQPISIPQLPIQAGAACHSVETFEERISNCDIDLSFNGVDTLNAQVRITAAAGPTFPFSMQITQSNVLIIANAAIFN